MSDVPEMTHSGRKTFAPRTATGWAATVLGFGVIAAVAVPIAIGASLSQGGDTPSPEWAKAAFLAIVLVVAVPAVILGVRARRSDRSTLGSIALGVAYVVGGWYTLTGVLRFFFE